MVFFHDEAIGTDSMVWDEFFVILAVTMVTGMDYYAEGMDFSLRVAVGLLGYSGGWKNLEAIDLRVFDVWRKRDFQVAVGNLHRDGLYIGA